MDNYYISYIIMYCVMLGYGSVMLCYYIDYCYYYNCY